MKGAERDDDATRATTSAASQIPRLELGFLLQMASGLKALKDARFTMM